MTSLLRLLEYFSNNIPTSRLMNTKVRENIFLTLIQLRYECTLNDLRWMSNVYLIVVLNMSSFFGWKQFTQTEEEVTFDLREFKQKGKVIFLNTTYLASKR